MPGRRVFPLHKLVFLVRLRIYCPSKGQNSSLSLFLVVIRAGNVRHWLNYGRLNVCVNKCDEYLFLLAILATRLSGK